MLHCDDAMLILDKPAGLPVDPPRAGGPSLRDHLPALRFGKRRDPLPAHRLDTDTAGCLALGRTAPAVAQLGALFATGSARKTYWAVLRGGPAADTGTIDAPLLKRSTLRDGWRMVADAAGKPARTDWRVLGRAPGLCWMEFTPRTGRTHQLRAHAAHLGAPIAGDARYGGGAGALHLLARALELPLPVPVAATAPVPPHMEASLRACGWRAGR